MNVLHPSTAYSVYVLLAGFVVHLHVTKTLVFAVIGEKCENQGWEM